MCQTLQIETKTTDAFGQKLLGMLNNAAIVVMTSVGHRVGLFDTMSELPPSTSDEIAEAAGLNERYVREWLGAMTVGGIVECDPAGPLYSLPAEHAACLTRAAKADNLALFAQWIPVISKVEDRIVECFQRGGGVRYEEYGRFHEVMAEESGTTVMSNLLDHVLPLAPEAKARLSKGIDVLDVGCGSGRAINFLAQAFPQSRFVGYDLCAEPIAVARAEAEAKGLTNVRFERRDLSTFDQDAPESIFDLVTAFDAIHDQARPDRVLAGIRRALKPGGLFLMQDIAGSSCHHDNMELPLAPLSYTISCMHCMTVSLAQNGMGLGAMWGEQKAREMLAQAGFERVEIKQVEQDILNQFYLCRVNGTA